MRFPAFSFFDKAFFAKCESVPSPGLRVNIPEEIPEQLRVCVIHPRHDPALSGRLSLQRLLPCSTSPDRSSVFFGESSILRKIFRTGCSIHSKQKTYRSDWKLFSLP